MTLARQERRAHAASQPLAPKPAKFRGKPLCTRTRLGLPRPELAQKTHRPQWPAVGAGRGPAGRCVQAQGRAIRALHPRPSHLDSPPPGAAPAARPPSSPQSCSPSSGRHPGVQVTTAQSPRAGAPRSQAASARGRAARSPRPPSGCGPPAERPEPPGPPPPPPPPPCCVLTAWACGCPPPPAGANTRARTAPRPAATPPWPRPRRPALQRAVQHRPGWWSVGAPVPWSRLS